MDLELYGLVFDAVARRVTAYARMTTSVRVPPTGGGLHRQVERGDTLDVDDHVTLVQLGEHEQHVGDAKALLHVVERLAAA